MNPKALFASTIALVIFGNAIVPNIAKADVPMRITPSGQPGWTLTVPDKDTTVSAYRGKLRLYDVHIAKMVEVTSLTCKQSPPTRTATWKYFADNGNADMGTFTVSCGLVSDLFSAYGYGKPEPTLFFQADGGPSDVPTLNITGGKIDKWIRFTNNFKPNR
jgi:hypothetical protein